MAETKIEWCDAVWNPTTGCTPVSPGCENCYAKRMARRLKAMGQPRYARGFAPAAHPDALQIPLKWRKPRRIFVDSMGDLFHKDISDGFIDAVFVVMGLARRHTFLVLTKRAIRMQEYCSSDETLGRWTALAVKVLGANGETRIRYHDDGLSGIRLNNVWLGVSVENQEAADERIPHLLRTPAAIRFVSAEPLLGPVDLSRWLMVRPMSSPVRWELSRSSDAVAKPLIDWVIVGGETGPHARPMHPESVRLLRDQCEAAGVPFFFKQWGEFTPDLSIAQEHGATHHLYVPPSGWKPCGRGRGEDGSVMMYRVGRRAAGRLLDGREWNEVPE